MKNKILFRNSVLFLLPVAIASGVLLGTAKSNALEVEGYDVSSLPTTINLNDVDDSDIQNYYLSLESLGTAQRQGTNLLKNLKTILKNGQKYYSYDSGNTIWDAYAIVDRDWDKSPASSLPSTAGIYNSSSNTITNYKWGNNKATYENPYLHALYYNRNQTSIAQAYGDHQNSTSTGINREHIWPKGAGFSSSGQGGARGDLMHLWAANGHVNNIHSNNYYGYVDKTKSYSDIGNESKYSMCAGNLSGASKTLGTGTVFEPQDSDKGDIARACFYMAARYNYYSGSDSDGIDKNNPNLELVNDISSFSNSGYDSTSSKTGKIGIIQDLLEWNRLDPPDEFEIHRNNLLYRNFTNNRNPFIDYPEWAEFIWGKSTNGSYSSTATGYATPSTDTINGYNSGSSTVSVSGVSLNKNSTTLTVGNSEILVATINPTNATNKNVIWSSNRTSVATVTNNGLVTAVSSGNATITARTSDGNYTATCSVTVSAQSVNVTSISLDKSEEELDIGGETILTPTILPSNATNKNIVWSSSNSSVASVSNGAVIALSGGTTTITATSVADNSKTASCNVTVYDRVVLDVSCSPFSETDTGSEETVTIRGIDYESLHGQIYSGALEFSKELGAYLGNTTSYGKNIDRIVINWQKYQNSDHLKMYEGTEALPTSDEISPTNNGLTTTYTFAKNSAFFKIEVCQKTYYPCFTSIELYFKGEKSLLSIEVKTSPDKTIYQIGEAFDPTGLVLTGTYSDSTTADISYANDSSNFSFSPSTSLDVSNTKIDITYGGKTASVPIIVDPVNVAVMNPGTNGSVCEVNSVSGIKVGTGSTGGTMLITLPKRTTSLSFYAAAWKGVSGLSINITGATVAPSSVSLTANDGISNNSPFTLSGDEEDYKFTISLSNINSPTVLTLSSSIEKRFVVWGAECEYESNENYSLIKNVEDLLTGDEIVFVGIKNSSYYGALPLDSQVLRGESVQKTSNTISVPFDLEVFTVIKNGNYYHLRNNKNKYLAAIGSGYTTKYEDTITNNSTFALSITSAGAITLEAQINSYNFFRYNGSNNWFSFYNSASYLNAVYIYKKDSQIEADSWSSDFMSDTYGCDTSHWSTLALSYDQLSGGAKTEIINVQANTSTDYSLRAQAMARYDYMMSDSRYSGLTNFIAERTVSSSSKPILMLLSEETRKPTIMIIVCSLISVSSIGGYFFIKRKKQEGNL